MNSRERLLHTLQREIRASRLSGECRYGRGFTITWDAFGKGRDPVFGIKAYGMSDVSCLRLQFSRLTTPRETIDSDDFLIGLTSSLVEYMDEIRRDNEWLRQAGFTKTRLYGGCWRRGITDDWEMLASIYGVFDDPDIIRSVSLTFRRTTKRVPRWRREGFGLSYPVTSVRAAFASIVGGSMGEITWYKTAYSPTITDVVSLLPQELTDRLIREDSLC